MKDKIKKTKDIDDDTTIPKINPPQLIKLDWNTCVICGLILSKKGKTHMINGIKYTTIEHKKYFKLWNKQVCWNCVFNLVKQFKSSH